MTGRTMPTSQNIQWLAILVLLASLPLTASPSCAHSFEVPKVFVLRLAIGFLWVLLGWNCFWKKENVICLSKTQAAFLALLIVYAIWIGLSALLSIDPSRSWIGTYDRQAGALTVFCFLIVSGAIVALPYPSGFFRAIPWIVFGTAIPACLVGVMQWYGLGWLPGWENAMQYRPHGTFHYVNTGAAWLALAIPLGWSLAIIRGWKGWPLIVPLLLLQVMLLAAYSRGAWLTLLINLALLAALAAWVYGRRRTLLSLLAVSAALAISPVLYGLSQPATTPHASADFRIFNELGLWQRFQSSKDTADSTVDSRFTFWKVAVRLIRERPVLGSGPETFHLLYPRYRPFREGAKSDFSSTVENAHNLLLHDAATKGGAAVLCWLGLCAIAFFNGLRTILFRRIEERDTLFLYGSLFIVWLGSLFGQQLNPHSLSGNFLEWVLLAIVVNPTPLQRPAVGSFSPFKITASRTAGVFCLASAVLLFAFSFCSLSADWALRKAWDIGDRDRQATLDWMLWAANLAPWEGLYLEQAAYTYLCADIPGIAQEERYRASWELYNWLFLRHPDEGKYLWGRAQAAWALSKGYPQSDWFPLARQDAERLRDYINAFPQLESFRIRLALAAGDEEEAKRLTENALQMFPDEFSLLHTAATFHFSQGEFDRAEELFRRILSRNPHHTASRYNLALLLWETGRRREAISLLQELIQMNPGYNNAYISLVKMYRAMGSDEEIQSLRGRAPAEIAPFFDTIPSDSFPASGEAISPATEP